MDSELALLYGKLKGATVPTRRAACAIRSSCKRDAPFRHPQFPIYLVTRLAAYDLADVKAMIDRSLAARNRGKFVHRPEIDNSDERATTGCAMPRSCCPRTAWFWTRATGCCTTRRT